MNDETRVDNAGKRRCCSIGMLKANRLGSIYSGVGHVPGMRLRAWRRSRRDQDQGYRWKKSECWSASLRCFRVRVDMSWTCPRTPSLNPRICSILLAHAHAHSDSSALALRFDYTTLHSAEAWGYPPSIIELHPICLSCTRSRYSSCMGLHSKATYQQRFPNGDHSGR
jgi:hypothetical protein